MADILQLARAASEAALAVEGVLRLGEGRFAEAATYGAGEKVSGVVVKTEEVEVYVVVRYPLIKPIPEIAENVIKNVSPQVEDRETIVVVEDIEVAGEE